MVDARSLQPLTERMIYRCLELAQLVDAVGDFTITLYIKRRGTNVYADANIAVKQPPKSKRKEADNG